MPVYNSSGTVQSGAHVVIGRVTSAGTSVAVTFTGSAAFTNSTSYQCVAVDGASGSVGLTYTSGTSFTITSVANTDVISYHCIGN